MDKVHEETLGQMAQREPSWKRGDGINTKTIWLLVFLSSSVLSTLGLSNHHASKPIIYYLFSVESLLTADVSSVQFCYVNFPSLGLRS